MGDVVATWHLDLLALGTALGAAVAAGAVGLHRRSAVLPVAALVGAAGAVVALDAPPTLPVALAVAWWAVRVPAAGPARVVAVALVALPVGRDGVGVAVGVAVAGLAVLAVADRPYATLPRGTAAAVVLAGCGATWLCVPDTEAVVLSAGALLAPLALASSSADRADGADGADGRWAPVLLAVVATAGEGAAGRTGIGVVAVVVAAGLAGWGAATAVGRRRSDGPGPPGPATVAALAASGAVQVVAARTIGLRPAGPGALAVGLVLAGLVLSAWWWLADRRPTTPPRPPPTAGPPTGRRRPAR